MKILKTASYKKKAQQEISYQEIFNKFLKKNGGDERKAAEAVLDLVTGGTWAAWDQERINEKIDTILKQFGQQQPIDEQMAEDQGHIDADRANERYFEDRYDPYHDKHGEY